MKLAVVFSTLVCLCAGQTGSGYSSASSSQYQESSPYDSSYQVPSYNQGASYQQRPSYGSHVPSNVPYGSAYGSYSHSYDYNREQSVLERLAVLESLIETREEIEAAQFERVAGLRDSANENVDFANNFNEYIYAEINNEQYQQNSRLDRLEERIAQIQAIRQAVEELDESADAANEQVIQERYNSKVQHTELKAIQNADADRANRIEITQQREDFVTQKVDDAEDRIAENFRSLDILETIVRGTIDSVRRTTSTNQDIVLEPRVYQEPTVVNFETPFVGEPHCNIAFVTGVQISNPASYAPHGYPTIYYGIEEEIWNVRSEISASDMSSGNFQVDKIVVTTSNVYFDNTVYSKDSFDGIVTENF